MTPITAPDLCEAVAAYEQYLGCRADDLQAWCIASMEVLGHFLDKQWVMREVFQKTSVGAFLNLKADAGADSHRSFQRVLKLAEALFNLQTVPGFEARVNRITERTDLEAMISEFEAAEMLRRSDIPFHFVKETQVKGADYDMDAVIGGLSVACEVKCKIEETVPTPNGVRNSLSDARLQLPTDRPCVVFLKIPEAWVKDPAIEQKMMQGLNAGFDKNKRISAVVVRWEQWFEFAGSSAACTIASRTEHNRKARHPLSEFGKIITTPFRTDLWRSIPDLVVRPRQLSLSVGIGDQSSRVSGAEVLSRSIFVDGGYWATGQFDTVTVLCR